MSATGKLLFLGTGGSMGVPVISCHCEVCTSSSTFNQRWRSAALLTLQDRQILIDAGPDLRAQALRWKIEQLDGLILTHAHQDHTGGIDELRSYYMQSHKPLPCLISSTTYEDVRTRYHYIFNGDPHHALLLPRFTMKILPSERGVIEFEGLSIRYFTFEQMGMAVNGFRFGDLAYVSDIHRYPETIFEDLTGVRHLVISALRFKPSAMHFSVDDAVAFAARVGAAHTWFTHLAHELDYEATNAILPPSMRLAYDGLELNFSAP